MNEFKTILIKLKEILASGSKVKVLDKDIAVALNIKPTTLASYKRRDKAPYRAILTYCHDNRLDVRKILFDDKMPIVSYPDVTVVEGKVRVKYFKTLKSYERYL